MATLQQEYARKNTFWRKWGAVFILFIFFIFSWGGQFATQLQTEKQISEQHGQEFQMSEFWPEFWSSTFENWQSEWLQLGTQALLISAFASYIFRKQDEEHFKTQLMLEDLSKQVKGLKKTKA
jgi:hypothetical protein